MISDIKKVLTDPAFEFSQHCKGAIPQLMNGRSILQNTLLIKVAIICYKQNLLSMREIKDVIVAFELICKQMDMKGVPVSNEFSMDVIYTGTRFINKAISPKMIRDWCLKTFKFLTSTEKIALYKHQRHKLQAKSVILSV